MHGVHQQMEQNSHQINVFLVGHKNIVIESICMYYVVGDFEREEVRKRERKRERERDSTIGLKRIVVD